MSTSPSTIVVVLADPKDPSLRALDPVAGVEYVVGQDWDAVAHALPRALAIFHCSGGRPLIERVFAHAPRLRWIHSRAAGVEHVLFPGLIESPVPLTNARGAYSRALGEWVLAAVLFFAKDFRRLLRSQAEGRWDPFDSEETHGRTLGILGYGDIGRAVAERARPFGLKVLALRRHPDRARNDPFVDEVLLPDARRDLVARSDYVVVASPLTPETRGLIGEAEIAAMKPTAVIINVGRGPVIDEAALIRALDEKRIRGAALDVFETEPLPAGHPFYRLENVVLSPHCADHVAGWLEVSVRLFVENLRRFVEGEPLLNVVDKRKGY